MGSLDHFCKAKWRDDRVGGGCKNGGMTGECNKRSLDVSTASKRGMTKGKRVSKRGMTEGKRWDDGREVKQGDPLTF